jgi:ATP-dependent Lhr-like helicase
MRDERDVSSEGDLEIELCGERLVLLPEHVVFRPITEPKRTPPLAFPLFVDRTREAVSSESMADRVRRMQVALEKYADTGR